MIPLKRGWIVFLASLQLGSSLSPIAYAASAGVEIEAVRTVIPTTRALGSIPQLQFRNSPSLSPLYTLSAPQIQTRQLLAPAPPLPGLLAAPEASAAPQRDAAPFQVTAARVNVSLTLPGLRAQAPPESSQQAAAQVFADLHGEQLVPAAPSETPPAVDAALTGARALVAREFQGTDYLRFKSANGAETLAAVIKQAQALPGRSAILLEAPTAAGKSTLADQLHKSLGKRIVVFPVDRYYKSASDLPRDAYGEPNFERQDSIYLERAAQDFQTLLAGGRIEVPAHPMDGPIIFNSGEYLQMGGDDVAIVDSVYASHDLFLKAAQGRRVLNIYLTAPTAVRLARRLKRDLTERGISVAKNLRRWSAVLANERENILPLQRKADVVLNLTSEDELRRLPETFAALLAQQRQDYDLFMSMLRASIAADRALTPSQPSANTAAAAH